MLVKEVMTKSVEVLKPEDKIAIAAQKMRDKDIGMLPIQDEKQVVGILTDRDIVVRCIAEQKNPTQMSVKEAMTPGYKYCAESQSLDEAARIMEENQLRRLVIVDDAQQITGILTLGDLSRRGSQEVAEKVLVEVSK